MASRIIKELLSDSDSDEYLRIPPRKKSKSTTRHSGTRAKSKLGLFSSSSGSDSCTEDVADEDISKVRDDMSATTKKGSFRSITKRSRDGCQKVTKTMSTPRAHSDKSPSCTPTSLSRRSSSHSTPSHQSHAKPKVLQYAKENDDSANNSQITHHLLKKIISKLDGYGQRIQAIEEKLDCNTTCSSETSTGTNSKSKGRKKEIPNVVRVSCYIAFYCIKLGSQYYDDRLPFRSFRIVLFGRLMFELFTNYCSLVPFLSLLFTLCSLDL